jgi:hypothetical protein
MSRKIINESVNAFLNKKEYKKSNMSVCQDYSGNYYLKQHGNTIAKIENDKIFISNAGWKSVTTKERLNELLYKLNKGYISQIRGVWYWNINNQIMTNKELISNSIKFPNNEFIPVDNYLSYVFNKGEKN